MFVLFPYVQVLADTAPDYQIVVGVIILKATIALALSRPILDLFGLDEDTGDWKPAIYACALVFGVLLAVDYSVSALSWRKVAEDAVVGLLSAATIRKGQKTRVERARQVAEKVKEEMS